MDDHTRRVLGDFERIATVSRGGWDYNVHYHPQLLHYMPQPCELALDVGCGAGRFTRELGTRAEHVFGVDLSPGMLEVARRLTTQANVEYVAGDVRRMDLPDDRFDCISSITCLHHMELAPVYARLAAALRPGGRLLVFDLISSRGVADRMLDAMTVPLALGLRLVHTGRLRESPDVRAAWRDHDEQDSQQLTAAEVGRAAAGPRPRASVRRLLLWRYLLIWTKPTRRSPAVAGRIGRLGGLSS
jgi:SAM-dependent methyltransferase